VRPRRVTREDLARATRAALGGRRQLQGVGRLAGGTTKGVYRLTLNDGATVIAYLWEDSENYWPQAPNQKDVADPFAPGDSVDLFATAHSRLASLGLRVPEIYLLDRDRAYYPADIAIVEDLPGEDLLALWERDPAAAEPTLARLREGLAANARLPGPRSRQGEFHRRWRDASLANSRPTGEYAQNPGYGPVADDFTRLETPDHWLGWLPDTPARSVRGQLQAALAGQVPGSVLDWVKIIDDPVFLTTGIRSTADPQTLIVRRAALAVVFALRVRAPQRNPEVLTGALTWAATGLNDPPLRRDRTWFDVNISRGQAEELLKHRIYEVETTPE
jgi:hypothetical protein